MDSVAVMFSGSGYAGLTSIVTAGCDPGVRTAGRDGVRVDGGGSAIWILKLADTGKFVESTAWTVNVESPAAIGEPEIAPLLASARPAGSAPPANDQTTFPTRPDAARVAEYAVPAVPFGSEVVVTRKEGFTCRVNVAVAVFCEESLTVTATENAPADPGVPESWPVVLRLSPCGSPDADQLYPPPPPDAESDCE